VLSQNFQERVWIVGELQNFKAKGRGRHRYFELVERNESEEEEGAPLRAVVEAVIFDKDMTIVNRRLRTATQAIALEDGLKVRVRGKVSLYQPRGRYQFVIDDIDPNYTLGDLLVQREKVLREIDKLGLRDRNLELAMPRVPLRIALVTAFESEAYNDFVQTLAGHGFNFDVTVFDVFVQGERLQETVTNALAAFAEAADDYDILVITRGGGSRSELGSWDDLEVAKAVAQHPLKVLIGIGHERDQSVLDHIAQSVKTPTAAAELLVERAREYQEQVEDTMLEIIDKAQHILRDEARELHQKGTALGHLVRAGLADARGELREARGRVARGARSLLSGESRGLLRRAGSIGHAAVQRFARERVVLQGSARRLGQSSRVRIERSDERLSTFEQRRRAVDPVRVLARGYAILRNDAGKALRSVAATKAGSTLGAQLADGRLAVEVRSVEPDKATNDTSNNQ